MSPQLAAVASLLIVGCLLAASNSCEASQVRQTEVATPPPCRNVPSVAFKVVGGVSRWAVMEKRVYDDLCQQVQQAHASTDDFYVTSDCQRCQRSGAGGSWQCQPTPEEPAVGHPDCQMALGPDCKRYLADKAVPENRCGSA